MKRIGAGRRGSWEANPLNPFGSAFIRLIRFSFLCQRVANNLAVCGLQRWSRSTIAPARPQPGHIVPKLATKSYCDVFTGRRRNR